MSPANESVGHPARPIIVCPLEFERTALRRAGLGRWAELCCCGPGSAGVDRWWAARTPTHAPIILAGLAGSLHDQYEAGGAWWISEVVDHNSMDRFAPSLTTGSSKCVVTGAGVAVGTPADKARLRAQTGADLVDLESVSFATQATQAGATWAIVRGVSDGSRSSLPRGIDRWVNERGSTRPVQVLIDLLRRPGELRLVRELHAHGRRSMAAVAERLAEHFGQPGFRPKNPK